jgi:tetratricopeptide (TPR) repeat protein/predicted Ser/Thr protein kinase
MDVQTHSPHGPSPASSQSTLPQIPGGRYHIVERLSTGAIGAVYKALDTILDRPVAVKCVHLDTPFADHGPDELRERFVREARIAARLQHPNIVTIHDIVATNDRGFIIMEFIEGQSLESLLSGKNRLSLPDGIRVISQLASALDYAHERQVVHRDVKPANILVSPSLWVWVTDFGIAKSELSTNLTMAGGVLGTPDYMSPEQAKGEDVDARSDLFSLGCILFECVTGEKPFRSPSLTGVLLSIINDEPVFPLNWRSLGLPNGLKPVLHHALEKERDRRFPTGADLVLALTQLTAGTEPVSTRVSADAKPPEAPAEAKAPEPAAEAKAPEPVAETKAAEPVAETKAPEPAAETKAPEPVAETKAPEPVAEAKAPEPVAETKAAEPVAETKGPEPVAEAKASETVAEARAPEPPVEERAPEANAEPKPAEPAAEAKVPEPESEPPNNVDVPVEREERATEARSEETNCAEAAAEPSGAAPTASKAEHSSTEETVMFDANEVERKPPTPIVDAQRVQELKDEPRPLRLSPNLSAELHRAEISPEEGFLLSRIDGLSRASDILSMSPMSEVDTAAALLNLLDKELILFGGKSPAREPGTRGAAAPPAPAAPAKPKGIPDEATVKELDRLLALAKRQCYADLLGVAADAPAAARKSAFLKIIGTYHPDKFPKASDEIREKLSRICAEASEALDQLANPPASSAPSAPSRSGAPSWSSSPGPTGTSSPPGSRPGSAYGGAISGESGAFDKRRYARELYDRAHRAFDMQDFWESIQLCRQAVEVDDCQSEYFHLLGRALMQNKKWRKEAADSFRRASDLDPGNLEYLGMLGAIYKAEGLQARANAILKKAQTLNPEYALPDIDGQVSVEAE